MSRILRRGVLVSLVIMIAGMLVCTGALAYQWYSGYHVGKLIIIDAVSDQWYDAGLHSQQRLDACLRFNRLYRALDAMCERLGFDWDGTSSESIRLFERAQGDR